MKLRQILMITVLTCIATLLFSGLALAVSPEVADGAEPDAELKAGLRLKSFDSGSGGEVYLGIDLGGGGRVENDFHSSGAWQSSNRVVLEYDPASGILSSTVTADKAYTLEYTVGDLAEVNYAEIYIRNKDKDVGNAITTTVNFVNVTINGYSLTQDFIGASSGNKWNITGIDMTDGAEITGELKLAGDLKGNEHSKLQIDIGYIEVPDTEGPVSSGVVLSPSIVQVDAAFTVEAFIDETATGGTVIASAHYSLTGGASLTMLAADGAFDNVSEVVSATAMAPETAGEYQVCVWGVDAAANEGSTTCDTLTVRISPEEVEVDIEGPVSVDLTLAPTVVRVGETIALSALIDDSATGGSTILRAHYSIDGGPAVAMLATDGAFDATDEQVASTIVAPKEAGDYQICIWGVDTAGNAGVPSCISFTVEVMGEETVTDSVGPVATILPSVPIAVTAGETITIDALIDDTATGGSLIAAAYYSVNGGPAVAMLATDGAFDAVSESATSGVVEPLEAGEHQVCVWGLDAAGNTGAASCQATVLQESDQLLYLPVVTQ